MKKILRIVLIVAIVIILLISNSICFAVTEQYDIDGDGKYTYKDIFILESYLNENFSDSSEYNYKNYEDFEENADLNKDGKINIDDMYLLIDSGYPDQTVNISDGNGSLLDDGIYNDLSGGSSGLTGNTGVIFDYLLGKGISPIGAAAVIGNMMQESRCRPNNLQDSWEKKLGSDEEYTEKVNNKKYTANEFAHDGAGYGLIQWTDQSRKQALYNYTINKLHNIDDLQQQLNFFWNELTHEYDGTYKAIKNATDIELATKQFCNWYENPGLPELDNRIKYSKDAYSDYQKNATNSNNKVQSIINLAKSKVGCAYVMGNTGPDSFDCSGLAYWVFKQNGINIPRLPTSYDNKYKISSIYDAQPGDLLVYSKEETGRQYGHVAIYIGNGDIVEAKGKDYGVVISEYKDIKECVDKKGFRRAYRFWN